MVFLLEPPSLLVRKGDVVTGTNALLPKMKCHIVVHNVDPLRVPRGRGISKTQWTK